VTSNHTHLLAVSDRPRDISQMMQQLEGEFAGYYNRRKKRGGAFWGDHFHCTMVQDGIHLLNCLQYIDLNMVRAGVVSHPRDWPWCGYQELAGLRVRFRLLDIDRLLMLVNVRDFATFVQAHNARIEAAIMYKPSGREPHWTEGVAVGSEDYVKEVAGRLPRRKRLRFESTQDGTWYVRENHEKYGKTRRSPDGVTVCNICPESI
jgi:putative transposase